MTFTTKTILGLFFFANTAVAFSIQDTTAYQELAQPKKETFNYNSYYVFAKTSGSKINLMAFQRVSSKFPLPPRDYNRDEHFGDWIRPVKNNCLNTRGIVLKRDSSAAVDVNANCTVTAGLWHDPYTNRSYNDADEIQIDHVVALKNAYMTGAYQWNKAKRCLYANYLGNKFHLMSVNGPENMKKSDKSPSEYVPPNESYVCEYLRNWLEVKYIWNLRMTPREIKAIETEVEANDCSDDFMTIPASEIASQRNYMEKNKNLCQ